MTTPYLDWFDQARADRYGDDEPPLELAPDRLWMQPPGSSKGDPRDWIGFGWPGPAGLETAMFRERDGVEIRTSELLIAALPLDVEQTELPPPLRLYLSAFVAQPPTAPLPAVRAAVILSTGRHECRLSLPAANLLAGALRGLTRAGELPEFSVVEGATGSRAPRRSAKGAGDGGQVADGVRAGAVVDVADQA